MGQISDTLSQLAAGKLSTGQAADRIRRARVVERPKPQTVGMDAQLDDDPDGVSVTDDGHEISQAYHDGTITNDQYGVLTNAAAEAKARGSQRR